MGTKHLQVIEASKYGYHIPLLLALGFVDPWAGRFASGSWTISSTSIKLRTGNSYMSKHASSSSSSRQRRQDYPEEAKIETGENGRSFEMYDGSVTIIY